VIPWYTKITATTSVQADSSSVQCDNVNRCPEHTSCCRLFTGQWGCCPLQNVSAVWVFCVREIRQRSSDMKIQGALSVYISFIRIYLCKIRRVIRCVQAVCCPDKEHCCPQGYTCDTASMSCHKLIMLQLETVPLTPVYLPDYKPSFTPLKNREIKCDDQFSCNDDETCCKTSDTTWGCCPSPNVCHIVQ